MQCGVKVEVEFKNGKFEYRKFANLGDMLNWQLSLNLGELDDIEAFDVYPYGSLTLACDQ